MNGYKYNYHIIKYPHYDTVEKSIQARQWCLEQFGKEPTERWGVFIDGFNFNDERDFMLFMLRWA
jgi:hypothetical protein